MLRSPRHSRQFGRATGFREWIKIDHQEVDGRDLVKRHHRVVHTAAPEQTAMNFRMQRFDAPIHYFRETGV